MVTAHCVLGTLIVPSNIVIHHCIRILQIGHENVYQDLQFRPLIATYDLEDRKPRGLLRHFSGFDPSVKQA